MVRTASIFSQILGFVDRVAFRRIASHTQDVGTAPGGVTGLKSGHPFLDSSEADWPSASLQANR